MLSDACFEFRLAVFDHGVKRKYIAELLEQVKKCAAPEHEVDPQLISYLAAHLESILAIPENQEGSGFAEKALLVVDLAGQLQRRLDAKPGATHPDEQLLASLLRAAPQPTTPAA